MAMNEHHNSEACVRTGDGAGTVDLGTVTTVTTAEPSGAIGTGAGGRARTRLWSTDQCNHSPLISSAREVGAM